MYVVARHHHRLLLLLAVLLYGAATGAAAAGGGPGGDDDGALLDLLQRVQSEALRAFGPRGFDPKLYVDMPLAAGADPGAAAAELPPAGGGPAPSRGEMGAFLARYLAPAGSDLAAADPPDLALPEPRGFLPRVQSGAARAWAREVHAMWWNLTRRVAPGVAAARHTLLPLPGRAVVPGSGYRELYCWDSYWVVRGLLVSKMYETAKEVVLNLLSLVERYGFVLNGARSYYTNRRVMVRDNQGQIHSLTRYQAMWNKPRPESATTDEQMASKLSSEVDKEKFYRQVASAAESGNPPDMTTLATTYIIPVDLNAFIYKMERDIEFFAELTGEHTTSKEFSETAKARQIAIDSILWNSEMEQWLDYWLPADVQCQGVYQWNSKSQNRNIFASNFIPIWLNAYHHSGVMRSLKASGLLHSSGIAASLLNTGQQWDFPNGWAPLQHLIVEGLVNCGSAEAREFAEDIATRWVRTNYAAYKESGVMYEKYDVEVCGRSGGSGEYKHQTGFGWSNGVVLSFLEEFGWPRGKEIVCS
ncbi:putative trehalase [Panicum miliaceum]|uniref:Trehalase n=1 Tax=Panicum miliaceum TaxID=4540 RepID=A0A3L6QMC9_PANMI|nr:putative trehalase [Panicum miliaceum]